MPVIKVDGIAIVPIGFYPLFKIVAHAVDDGDVGPDIIVGFPGRGDLKARSFAGRLLGPENDGKKLQISKKNPYLNRFSIFRIIHKYTNV